MARLEIPAGGRDSLHSIIKKKCLKDIANRKQALDRKNSPWKDFKNFLVRGHSWLEPPINSKKLNWEGVYKDGPDDDDDGAV